MKRKILSFVLVLCLIIPCALVFTACGKKDEDPDDDVIYVGSQAELLDEIEDVDADEVIKLSQDINLTDSVVITSVVTIDLNGKTLTQHGTEASVSMFVVMGGGVLTFEGNGLVNAATDTNDYSMAVWAKNGGEVIINGGTFTNNGGRDFEIANPTRPNNNEMIYASDATTETTSKITINGGVFAGNVENETYGARFTLNKLDGSNSKIIVKGGTFKSFNPKESLSENPQADFVAEGYTSVKSAAADASGHFWYTVIAE